MPRLKELSRRKKSRKLFTLPIRWIFVCFVLLLTSLMILQHYVITINNDNKNDNDNNGNNDKNNAPIMPQRQSNSKNQLYPATQATHHYLLHQKTISDLFLYNQNDYDNVQSILPDWIINYVKWHNQIRQQYPGMELFTNPNAPNLLIRTCLGLCGGLHDRLGQLPWDLYLANQTNRILLMAWQRPKALENFFIPNNQFAYNNNNKDDKTLQSILFLNWTVPYQAKFGFDDIRRVRNETEMFNGYPEANPTDEFWNEQLDAAIHRATIGEYRNIKVLRHRILGHLGQEVLERRLQITDDSLHTFPVFGAIFWLFFRPSPPVEQQFISAMQQMSYIQTTTTTTNDNNYNNNNDQTKNNYYSLLPYSAVHCRVRHPKATEYGIHVKGKNPKYPADKTGLPWEGSTRQFALDVAKKALACAANTTHNIYFLSDSNDLVRHVAFELYNNPQFVQANRTILDMELYEWTNRYQIQARPQVLEMENAHIDRQKGRDPPAYFPAFVDLLIAIHAQCVIYGIGYYAVFAGQISGSKCPKVYDSEAWGDFKTKPVLQHLTTCG